MTPIDYRNLLQEIASKVYNQACGGMEEEEILFILQAEVDRCLQSIRPENIWHHTSSMGATIEMVEKNKEDWFSHLTFCFLANDVIRLLEDSFFMHFDMMFS